MKASALIETLAGTIAVYGDREINLIEEGTGEIRYVVGISFDTKGDTYEIEHLGYGDLIE